MTTIIPQCSSCRHLRLDVPGQMVCKAFPQGVPLEIALNQHDHRKSYPGDGGVRFEPAPEAKSPFDDDEFTEEELADDDE